MLRWKEYLLIAGISIILISIIFITGQPDTDNNEIEPEGSIESHDYTVTTTENELDDSESVANKIFIKGSDTILPVSNAESKAYMKLHPETDIIVIGGGSSLGIASFMEGEVEIAMASRKIKDSEIEEATEKGIQPVETIIAWDGIAVIVNKNNQLNSLSLGQLKKIYTGEVTNWKDVGGADEEIEVLVRDASSGTYAFFKENVLENNEYTSDAFTEPNTEAVVREVESNSSAIGYIGLAYLDDSVKTIGLGTGDTIAYPETESILKGEYPLSRPLQYYTNGEPRGHLKDYIDFVLSDQGQEIIEDVGYLPIA